MLLAEIMVMTLPNECCGGFNEHYHLKLQQDGRANVAKSVIRHTIMHETLCNLSLHCSASMLEKNIPHMAWQAITVWVPIQESSPAYEEHYYRVAKELSLPQLGFFGGPVELWLHICSENSEQHGLRLAQQPYEFI